MLRLMRLWGWPLLLALLTTAGLFMALVGDGWWDTLSTLALGIPLLIGSWHALRR
ncbi:MAG: hypothetical protein ACI8WM_003487 [Burkholderiaceae bacterium]|jgi:hypothetical protein